MATFPQTTLELAQQYQHYTMLPDPPLQSQPGHRLFERSE